MGWPIHEISRNCASEGGIGSVKAPDSAVRARKARLAAGPRQAQDRPLIGLCPRRPPATYLASVRRTDALLVVAAGSGAGFSRYWRLDHACISDIAR